MASKPVWELDSEGWPLCLYEAPSSGGQESRLIATFDLPEGSDGTDAAAKQVITNAHLCERAPVLLHRHEKLIAALRDISNGRDEKGRALPIAKLRSIAREAVINDHS